MKLTEKDKKILVFGGVAVAILLLVFALIMPLFQTGQKLSDQIQTEEKKKQENELKVSEYPSLQQQEKDVTARYEELRQQYYGPMTSADIDRLMTGIGLEKGIRAENLNIQMPKTDEYATLDSYLNLFADDSAASTTQTEATFEGVYKVEASMTMSGSREQLQSILDDCMAQAPKMQVTRFSWTENRSESSAAYSLSIDVNLYMCEDKDAYIMKQLAKEAAGTGDAAATEQPADIEDELLTE